MQIEAQVNPPSPIPSIVVSSLAVLGGVGVVVGAALPWITTGVSRSAFTMARIASEIGVLDTSVRKFAVTALLATPIVVSLVLLLLGLGKPKLAGLIGLPLGVAGLGGGIVGSKFSSTTLAGPLVCLVGGVLTIVGAWGLLLLPSRRN